MSYKIEVLADGTGKWLPNGMAFASHGEAYDYGMDLWARWAAVSDMRVVESTSSVNYRYIDGRLLPATARIPGSL